MTIFNEKDALLLHLLQEDSRLSLTALSKEVGLSVDAVKKRLRKLEANGIFRSKIQLRPRHFGYANIVEVNIKLSNYDGKTYEQFIKYLVEHPRISQVIKLSGGWDLKIVLMAKDYEDQGIVAKEIRLKFSHIILDWTECLTTQVLKFEDYNLQKLQEYEAKK